MAERVPHVALTVLEPDLRPTGRIELARVERAGHEAGFEREQRDHRFENAGRAERVPGPALRRARACASGEQLRDDARFHFVVLLARRAMKVDVVDVGRLEPAATERIRDGEARTEPFGVWRG